MDITKPQLVKVGAFDYFFSGRFCNTPVGLLVLVMDKPPLPNR